MSHSALLIGIDGGGTKTIAWLVDGQRWKILGKAESGPSNLRSAGPDQALQNLQSAIEMAFAAAEIAQTTVAAACLGLAGADRDAERYIVENWAAQIKLAKRVQVVNDALPLLSANTISVPFSDNIGMNDPDLNPQDIAEDEHPVTSKQTFEIGPPAAAAGIALICGTGSLAFGCNRNGQTGRSGGWGHLLGDEGSGYRMGQAALSAITRWHDGRGPATALTTSVLQQLQLSEPNQLIAAVYGSDNPKSLIAGLSPLVFAAASQDLIAGQIIQQSVHDLSLLVATLADRLEMRDRVSLRLAGSILLSQSNFRDAVIRQVRQSGIHVRAAYMVSEPVTGSVNMACQMWREAADQEHQL